MTEEILLKISGDSTGGEAALDRMQKRLRQFGSILTAVSAGALVAFAKLGQGGATIEALEQKFHRAMQAFGMDADQMLASWKKASGRMLSSAEIMRKANYLMLTGIPVSELEWMFETVRNAAQATGQDMEFLFNKLAMGLARKSKLMLDDLGIILSITEANASYAASIGKTTQQLNANEEQLAFVAGARKAAARQAEILGDATETSSTILAKARSGWSDMVDTIKKAFIPVALLAAKLMTAISSTILQIPPGVLKTIAALAALAAVFGVVLGVITTLIGSLPLLSSAFAILAQIAPVVIPLIAVIAAIGAAIAILAKAWASNWGGIQDTVKSTIDSIRPYISALVTNVRYWFGLIKEQLEGISLAIQALLLPALNRLRAALADGGGLKTFLLFLRDASSTILSVVRGLLQTIRFLLEGRADIAWMPLKTAALNVMTLIALAWKKYVKGALVWGWNLVTEIANGMISAARTALVQAANYIGQLIGSFFAAASPPKKGPLSAIVKWGKGLMETYLRAFGLADFGILRDSLAPVKAALQSAVGLGDLSQSDATSTFRAVRKEVGQLIAGFRETGVISEDVLQGINDRLGEGGAEYTKYLRLMLEHQGAVSRLEGLEGQIEAAREKGFIPKTLSDQLAAAQDEVDKKKEAVEWQKEYLAALQDGVDLQLEMIEAIKEVSQALKDMAAGAAGVGDGAIQLEMPGAVGPIGGAVTKGKVDFDLGGGFSKEFEEMREQIKVWFEGLPAQIGTWLDGIKATVAAKALEIWGAFSDTEIGQSILAALLPVQTWLATEWPLMWSGAMEAVSGFVEKFQFINQIIQEQGGWWDWLKNYIMIWWIMSVQPIIDKLKADWMTIWPQVQAVAETAWIVIKEGALAFWDVMVNTVWPELKSAWDELTGLFDGIGITWPEVWNALKTAAGIVFGFLAGLFAVFVGVVVGVATSVAMTINHVITTMRQWRDAGRQFLIGLGALFVGLWKIIKGIFTLDWPLALEGLETLWWGIYNTIESVVKMVILVLKTTVGTILVIIGGFVRGFLRFFQNLYDRLVGNSIIPEMMTSIKDWILGTITDVLTGIGEFVTDMVTAGGDLIQGLWDGIAAKWAEFLTWWNNTISNVVDGIKTVLGIESPSKVFQEIGEMAVKGLEIGLNLGNLSGQLQGLIPSAAGAAAGPGQIVVVQIPGGLQFPSVRDGRDADSFIEQLLQRTAEEAQLRGLVPGGL